MDPAGSVVDQGFWECRKWAITRLELEIDYLFITPLPSSIFVYSIRWCTGVAPVLKSEPWHCLGDHKGCRESNGLHPKWLPERQVLDLLLISRSCHNAALPELLHSLLAVALAPLSCIVCVWGYSRGNGI